MKHNLTAETTNQTSANYMKEAEIWEENKSTYQQFFVDFNVLTLYLTLLCHLSQNKSFPMHF